MNKCKKSQSTLGAGRRRATTYAASYHFAREGSIPPGRYLSRIDNIEETTTKSGIPAIDICYSLNDDAGNAYTMKQRLPLDSELYDDFADAMFNAGADEDTALEDLVGVNEWVDLDYNSSGFAVFENRIPLADSAEND